VHYNYVHCKKQILASVLFVAGKACVAPFEAPYRVLMLHNCHTFYPGSTGKKSGQNMMETHKKVAGSQRGDSISAPALLQISSQHRGILP
jgi:hypothetical protein